MLQHWVEQTATQDSAIRYSCWKIFVQWWSSGSLIKRYSQWGQRQAPMIDSITPCSNQEERRRDKVSAHMISVHWWHQSTSHKWSPTHDRTSLRLVDAGYVMVSEAIIATWSCYYSFCRHTSELGWILRLSASQCTGTQDTWSNQLSCP